MNATVRRLENNLVTLGTGVIAFGIWSVLKIAFELLLGASELVDSNVPDESKKYLAIAYIIFWALVLIDLAARIYVGLSARAEGKGKRKSKAYLVCTIVLMLDLLLTAFADLYFYAFSLNNIAAAVVPLLVDGTSFFITLELFIYAVRLRKLRRLEASPTNQKGGSAA